MDTLITAVQLVVVPALLIVGVVSGFAVAGRVPTAQRTRAYSGFWAGILLSLMTLVIGDDVGVQHTQAATGQAALVSALCGIVAGLLAGVLVPKAFRSWQDTAAIGLVTLAQAWGAAAMLMGYAVWPAARVFTLWFALAVALTSCLAILVLGGLRPTPSGPSSHGQS